MELSLHITIMLSFSQLPQHLPWRCDISILLEFNLGPLNKTVAYRPFPNWPSHYFNHMELNNYSLILYWFWQQSWQVVSTANFPSRQIKEWKQSQWRMRMTVSDTEKYLHMSHGTIVKRLKEICISWVLFLWPHWLVTCVVAAISFT